MASGTLASLKILLGLDSAGVEQGVTRAKGAIGGLSSGTKLAFGVIGGAAAIGFGIMTRGALESEEAQGRFMAATGRSREEAKKFATDMNGLVGTSHSVGMSFDAITAAGIAVSQQFGITGQKATDLTDDILGFAKVTGQDAAGAADQLDAALGAFGLGADDAAGFMDKLVFSTQKYGTDSGPATLGVLQSMAPALQAMGMNLDDGVGLLNLFETAELDAGSAQRGLNKAVQELKPGETLDDLIAQIGAIEDPTLRAQKAIEIFGTRSGVGLANAIRPGMTSLDEFGVTAGEAAGSVDQAADDMLTTSDKIKGAFEKLGAGLRDVGGQFGPLVSGMGAIGSLAAPLIGKLSGVTAALWAQVAAQKAANGGWLGLGKSLVPAGAALGIIGAELMVANKLSEDQAAKAIAATAAIEAMTDVTLDQADAFDEAATQLDAARQSTQLFGLIDMEATRAQDALAASLRAAAAAARGETVPAIDDARESMSLAGVGAIGMADNVLAAAGIVRTSADEAGDAFDDLGEDAEAMQGAVSTAAAETAEEFHARMVQMHQDAAWAGETTPGAFSQGLRSAFDTVRTAFTDLKDLMKNTLSPAAQEAELIGIATSKRLAKALDDGRPEVRGAAQQIALDTIADLHLLDATSPEIGRLTTKLLASALPNERPALQDAINLIVGTVTTPLGTLPGIASTSGTNITQHLASGLTSSAAMRSLRNAASDVANVIKRGFLLESPAKEGPWSEKGGPFAWMQRAGAGIGENLARGLHLGIPGVDAVSKTLATRVGGVLGNASQRLSRGMPDVSSMLMAPSPGYITGERGAVHGGDSFTVNAYGQTLDEVEQQFERLQRRRILRAQMQGTS